MTLQAILSKHFQPAGVMGGGNPIELERDLRRCARLNALRYGMLLVLFVAVLTGFVFIVVEDLRAGASLSTMGLASAIIVSVFEGIRRTVRTWSQASLLAQLSRRLETAQFQSVIETLIEPED